MADYDIPYSSDQIETALDNSINPDNTPTATSGKFVTSDGINSAIVAESTNRAEADSELDTRVTALETAPSSPPSARYTHPNGSTGEDGVLTGSWATDYESDLSVSRTSGVFTLSAAGFYLVFVQGRYREIDSDSLDYFTVQYRVDGSVVEQKIINETYGEPFNSFFPVVVTSSSKTVDIYLYETPSTIINWYDVSITFIKIG